MPESQRSIQMAREIPHTVIRFPEVDKRPIEPYLALVVVRAGFQSGLEVRVSGGWVGKDGGVRTDGFEALVFAQARHSADEGLDAEAIEDWVDCSSVRVNVSSAPCSLRQLWGKPRHTW